MSFDDSAHFPYIAVLDLGAEAEAAKVEPKNIRAEASRISVSRSCKTSLFERAKASDKNSRLIFFGEQCLLMQNRLSGSSVAPHRLSSLCFVHDNVIIFPVKYAQLSKLSWVRLNVPLNTL